MEHISLLSHFMLPGAGENVDVTNGCKIIHSLIIQPVLMVNQLALPEYFALGILRINISFRARFDILIMC